MTVPGADVEPELGPSVRMGSGVEFDLRKEVASSAGGNPLSEAEQVAKLRRVVEVAREVWG